MFKLMIRWYSGLILRLMIKVWYSSWCSDLMIRFIGKVDIQIDDQSLIYSGWWTGWQCGNFAISLRSKWRNDEFAISFCDQWMSLHSIWYHKVLMNLLNNFRSARFRTRSRNWIPITKIDWLRMFTHRTPQLSSKIGVLTIDRTTNNLKSTQQSDVYGWDRLEPSVWSKERILQI